MSAASPGAEPRTSPRAVSPVRLHVYFKLALPEAEAWRARWREAARRTAEAVPGLQIVLSERPDAVQAQTTWMESYRGGSPEQMATGEAAMARALLGLPAERHREVFVETFRAP
ncbi:DUF4936 family protein [Pseudorhodoferax sp.]|jgi:hypothetical protein|uniref:DUF4936 family protein n=1 Tax=Pseudorhodoferax sp. TaxID=1993553 RepID=UPI001B51663E|nr:DUF4936 family protein [Pseudorhodoferax sp.]MBP8146367.1 DUF4936 family protein [Inhella sp.]